MTKHPTIAEAYAPLSKHPEGSIRELMHISLPLMLAAASGTLMLFFDRVVLAHYSLEAMNSAASAGMVIAVFQYGSMIVASIAEVFVGQFNGSRRYKKISTPVWQMLWFALLTSLVFLPLGLLGGKILLAKEFIPQGEPYFKWFMLFGPFFPAMSALSAFFIGRGKVKIVTLVILLASTLNFFLDLLLVFGLWHFPEMGTRGAAIASGISQSVATTVLLVIFLNKTNRKRYNTTNFQFNFKSFFDCLRIGTPAALGHMIEIAAWAYLLQMLAGVSKEHVTVVNIGMTIWFLFTFYLDGLQKGVTAVSANLIGAKKSNKVNLVYSSGIKLQIIFCILLTSFLIFYPDILIDNFLPHTKDLPATDTMRTYLEIACRWTWLAFLFDGMQWVTSGVLMAGGDTKFILFMAPTAAWFFAILPILIFVKVYGGGPTLTSTLFAIYAAISFACYYWRFKTAKWREIQLI